MNVAGIADSTYVKIKGRTGLKQNFKNLIFLRTFPMSGLVKLWYQQGSLGNLLKDNFATIKFNPQCCGVQYHPGPECRTDKRFKCLC